MPLNSNQKTVMTVAGISLIAIGIYEATRDAMIGAPLVAAGIGILGIQQKVGHEVPAQNVVPPKAPSE